MAKSQHDIAVVLKARDETARALGSAGRAVDRLKQTMQSYARMALTYFGARAIIRFLKDSIELWNRQERAVRQLRLAMELLGKESETSGLKEFAGHIQALTTVGDEAAMELMQLGASMGKMSGDTLKGATLAAIGFSTTLRMDAVSAMRLVAKAAQGNTESLGRYGIEIDKTLSKDEQFQQILAQGIEHFKHAQDEAATTAGQVSQLGNAWSDAKEQLGEYLLSFEGYVKVTKGLEKFLRNFPDYMQLVAGELALLVEKARSFFMELLKDWKSTLAGFLTDVVTAPIDQLNMAVENIVRLVKAFRNWVSGKGFDFTPVNYMFELTRSNIAGAWQRRKKSDMELGLEAAMDEIAKRIEEREMARVPEAEAAVDAVTKAIAGATTTGPGTMGGTMGSARGYAAAIESRTLRGVTRVMTPAEKAVIESERHMREMQRDIRALREAAQRRDPQSVQLQTARW